ncbi:DUF2304 domain-containing protein [Bradyrhizobium sp. WSM1743]|uniref:DUF2304 domain-containing protein n=1 Tax=Bradyrhizobium sp. WSM1743 TaxID=318996 RepID=UPI00041E6813|nr:DUF2304 domain-containing protein [Bradyrhizobium sp. WSM1743]
MDWKIAGALAFGLVLGWNVYFVNRYRRGDISFGDLTTLIGVVGGAAVLALFPNDTNLFGAYGVGLGIGFFAYFLLLLGFVKISPNFDSDWFLDGRRKNPQEGFGYGADTRPTLAPMYPEPPRLPQPKPEASNVNINFHGTNPGEGSMVAPSSAAPRTLSAPNPDATRVQRACAEVWSKTGPSGPFKGASYLFVIEVAHRLGISLSGTSDQIIDAITGSASWTALADGSAAREAAAQGKLVIAGVRSDAGSPPQMDGQLAIVTAGSMNAGGWAPSGYWGSTDPEIADLGGAAAPISDRFRAELKDKIIYRCRDI